MNLTAIHRNTRFCCVQIFVISVCISLTSVIGCEPRQLPQETTILRVIDGDTVQIFDGRLIRYLGIDTPEMRRRVGESWVEDPEPYASEASKFNRSLVEGKRVRLEYDMEKTDRYGRLLCYVYVDSLMVNAAMLEEGLATLLIIKPNVRYKRLLEASQESARLKEKGLWRPVD